MSKAMPVGRFILAGLLALAVPAAGPVAGKNPDLFAAIAYAPSTGTYGFANRQNTRAAAEKLAVKKCGAADAQVVVWVRDGWCALAVSKSTRQIFGYGSAVKQADAERLALQGCSRVRDATIAVSVFSEK